jgi:hypothetical protein
MVSFEDGMQPFTVADGVGVPQILGCGNWLWIHEFDKTRSFSLSGMTGSESVC